MLVVLGHGLDVRIRLARPFELSVTVPPFFNVATFTILGSDVFSE